MWENGLEMKLEDGIWENEIVKMQLERGWCGRNSRTCQD